MSILMEMHDDASTQGDGSMNHELLFSIKVQRQIFFCNSVFSLRSIRIR